jgi:hypothetical protein
VDCPTTRQPPLWPCLLLCAALAAWVDFGSFHRDHTGDSIVPVLTSLYRWTPYFWKANRIGMLVPLLALPFRHPLANLMVQSGLVLFAAFTLCFLLPRYVLRTAAWPAAGAVAVGLFFLLPRGTRFFITFGQPHYVVGLALGLGALVIVGGLAPRWRLARLLAAVALVLLAHWVNSATAAVLAPLVVLRGWLADADALSHGRPWWRRLADRETVLGLAILGAGCGGALVSHRLFPCYEDPLGSGLAPVRQWPAAWGELARGTWDALTDRHWASVVDDGAGARPPHPRRSSAAVATVVGLLLLAALRQHPKATARAALVLGAAAVEYAGFTGTVSWTALNLHHWKYWIPVVVLLQAALANLAAGLAVSTGARWGPGRAVATPALLLLAASAAYGLPSPGQVRRDVEQVRGLAGRPAGYIAAYTADVLATRCTHVAGHYDQVWLTVFQANLALYERGVDRVVWGLATRCLTTLDLWAHAPPEDVRVAGLRLDGGLDPHADLCLKFFFPTAAVAEEAPTLWVYRDRSAEGAAVSASWHGGFYNFETSAEANLRWCREHGKLTLFNPADRPRTVTLDMQLFPSTPRWAGLWIDGPLGSEYLVLHCAGVPWRRTLRLPPGRTTLCFACDGPDIRPTPGDYRRATFRVMNFRMREEIDHLASGGSR